MGLGGISIWQLLIILAIVVMIFGTKRLKNLGSDLGGALKGFKNSMAEEEKDDETKELGENAASKVDANADSKSTSSSDK
jgi:sec-independent protein translocase protein TatA